MKWCERYTRHGNPLFIPEMAASLRATGNAVYALAHFRAIGIGPFAIEHIDHEKEQLVTQGYGILGNMSERILQAQRDSTLLGLSPQVGFDWAIDPTPQRGALGNIAFAARFDGQATAGDLQTTILPTLGAGRWDAPPGTLCGAVMILQTGPEDFIVVGMGVTIMFSPADGQGKIGLDRVQEGTFASDGSWLGTRWLNGDETHQGRHIHLPDKQWSIQQVRLYRY